MAFQNSSNPLHAFAMQLNNIYANRYFRVSKDIGPDNYEESLACEIGITLADISKWNSLLKFDGLSKKNRLGKLTIDYTNWLEVLGLNKGLFQNVSE